MHSSTSKKAPWWLAILPNIAVFAVLGSVAYIGYVRDWQWSQTEDKEKTKKIQADDDDDGGPADDSPPFNGLKFDPTLHPTHSWSECKNGRAKIKFQDAEAIRKAGIALGTARERELNAVLTVTGSVDFDPSRVARVSSRAPGVLWAIDKLAGEQIVPNELLAIVDSAEVGKAKSAFFQAKVMLELKQDLRKRLTPGVTPESTIVVAEAGVSEARVHLQTAYQSLLNLELKFPLPEFEKFSDDKLRRELQFLGLNDVPGLGTGESTNNLLAIRNPLPKDGVVLQRDGVKGELVTAGQPIFVVGDTSKMMILLDIRQEDMHLVKLDKQNPLRVKFYPDGNRDSPVECTIEWIGQDVDPKTRTVKARALADNSSGRLKAHAFGKADIALTSSKPVVAVPDEAIQWEGCSHIVFVLDAPAKFEVRRVELGIRQDGDVEVVKGLKPGERIAVVGSHVLLSHLFRDRIGSAEE